MAVMVPMPRENWTDERLDDLNKKVDDGFADTKAVIADTKAEMRQGFARVDGEIKELRREMNARFENLEARIDARFDALQRNQTAGLFVIVAAIIGSNTF
ncbi:MAG TPA: hypothetical protein VLI94_06505 [Solirubrobacterales bacterium]|nr:hypothetical protein [Solirubrobacterales bacterium]